MKLTRIKCSQSLTHDVALWQDTPVSLTVLCGYTSDYKHCGRCVRVGLVRKERSCPLRRCSGVGQSYITFDTHRLISMHTSLYHNYFHLEAVSPKYQSCCESESIYHTLILILLF